MKISDEVMSVLSTMECEGVHARIGGGQLDRKLYLKTNKVLESMGGKWNRRAKAHVFTEPVVPLMESVLLTGEITTPKDIGFFATPLKVGRKLVELADVQPGNLVLEPSAGQGDLVAAIVERHPQNGVVAIEREERFAAKMQSRFSDVTVHVGDFIASAAALHINADEALFDRVIMNPPFIREDGMDHLDHVRAAHALLRPGGRLVSVLPKSVDFRQDKRHTAFREWFGDYDGVTRDLPEKSFAPSGTNVRTVVLVLGA